MMSSPATTSRFSVEASASASKQIAGRRLANTAISLRSRSSPASGRFVRSTPAHFGPPTAPISTASAERHEATASSVIGTPCWS